MSRDISPLSGDTRHDFRSHPSRTPIEGCGLAEAACGHLVEQLRVQQTAEVSCASCICFGRVDETRSTPDGALPSRGSPTSRLASQLHCQAGWRELAANGTSPSVDRGAVAVG